MPISGHGAWRLPRVRTTGIPVENQRPPTRPPGGSFVGTCKGQTHRDLAVRMGRFSAQYPSGKQIGQSSCAPCCRAWFLHVQTCARLHIRWDERLSRNPVLHAPQWLQQSFGTTSEQAVEQKRSVLPLLLLLQSYQEILLNSAIIKKRGYPWP